MPGKIFAWHNMDMKISVYLNISVGLLRNTLQLPSEMEGVMHAQGNLEEREPVCNKIK